MLDSRFIRENLEKVKDGANKKKVKIDIDRWVFLDDEKKTLQQKIDEKRSEQNKISKEVGMAEAKDREKLILSVGDLKKNIQVLEEEEKKILEE